MCRAVLSPIARSVKRLNGAGLTDDIIRDIIRESDDVSMVKLSNAARKGLDGELLEAFARNADVLGKVKDGKQLFVLKGSRKEAGHLVRLVREAGDDFLNLYQKHGDDVVDALLRNGDEEIVNVTRLITEHGDDAVKAINEGITPRQIRELLEKDIKPDDYLENGIIDWESAERFIKSGRYSDEALINAAKDIHYAQYRDAWWGKKNPITVTQAADGTVVVSKNNGVIGRKSRRKARETF